MAENKGGGGGGGGVKRAVHPLPIVSEWLQEQFYVFALFDRALLPFDRSLVDHWAVEKNTNHNLFFSQTIIKNKMLDSRTETLQKNTKRTINK